MAFKKPFTQIALTSFIVALLGLVTNVYKYTGEPTSLYIKLIRLLRPFSFFWFDNETVSPDKYTFNILNLSLSFILLVAAILYVVTKHREILFIRFIFSLIFLTRAIGFIWSISAFFFVPQFKLDPDYPLWTILYWLVGLTFFYLSYLVLKQLNHETAPDTEEYGDDENKIAYLVPASKWQRAFHAILNYVVGVVLFWPLLDSLRFFPALKNALDHLSAAIGERFTLYSVISFFGVMYYFIAEGALGASPAMLLSGTRVVTTEGERPNPGTILKRTICRLIPFDGLSFLLGGGWHDDLSKTLVVKEKRRGVNPVVYFFIIPIAAFVAFCVKIGKEEYERLQQESARKEQLKRLNIQYRAQLDKADTSTILNLIRIDDNAGWDKMKLFLKVQSAGTNEITFSRLYVNDQEADSQEQIERAYNQAKSNLKRITFSKQQIIQALDAARTNENHSFGLKIGTGRYAVEEMDYLFGPNVKLNITGMGLPNNKNVVVYLANDGWKATLTDVKCIEGDVVLSTTVPKPIYGLKNLYGRIFTIEGRQEKQKPYVLNFTVLDTLGRQQIYQITGNAHEDGSKTLLRLK